MPGPTTEVLSDDLHKLTVEVAKLSAEFGLAKWLLGLALVATLSGIGGGIWWAATITAEVKNLSLEIAHSRLNGETSVKNQDTGATPIPDPKP